MMYLSICTASEMVRASERIFSWYDKKRRLNSSYSNRKLIP